MSAILTDVIRTANRTHLCYYCNQVINRGDKHGYRVGVEDGEGFWQMRHHPECDLYARITHWDYEATRGGCDMSKDDQLEYRQRALECAKQHAPLDAGEGAGDE
jgi:hypothetical protein